MTHSQAVAIVEEVLDSEGSNTVRGAAEAVVHALADHLGLEPEIAQISAVARGAGVMRR